MAFYRNNPSDLSFTIITFWLTILLKSNKFSNLTKNEMIVYYTYMGIISLLNSFPLWRFSDSIRYGEIAKILIKPLSHILTWWFVTLSEKILITFFLIIAFTIFQIAGFKVFQTLYTAILFFISLFLGTIGNFLISYIIGLSTIWFKRVHGINDLIKTIEGVFAGRLIPLNILPSVLQMISTFLPFMYFSYLPIDILLYESSNIYKNIIIEIIWLLIFLYISRIIWKLGIKNLDIAGI